MESDANIQFPLIFLLHLVLPFVIIVLPDFFHRRKVCLPLFHPRRVFRNFLLIYISFALCMSLMLIPLYTLSLREAEKRTIETANETLHNGIAHFEDVLERAAGMASTLFSYSNIYPINYLSEQISTDNAVVISKALSAYDLALSSLPMVIRSGIHFSNDALISDGSFFRHANDAFDPNLGSIYTYEYNGIVLNNFNSWVQSLGISGVSTSIRSMRMGRTDATQRDIIVHAIALPLNTPGKDYFFYTIYDAQDVFDLLVLPQYQHSCSLTLQDSHGIPFLSHASDTSDRFVQLQYVSPLYGFTATLRIDQAVISAQMHSFRVIMMIILFAYIAIGIILATLFSWQNAKPMVRVIHAAEQTGLESGVSLVPPLSLNSYQYIHELIDSMGREVTASRQKQELQRVQLQESMFDRLLRGDLYHEGSRRQAQSFFPNFPACSCMIVVQLMHSHQMDIETFSRAQLCLSDIFKARLDPGIRVHFFSNLAVLLCPCSEDHYHEESANIISTLVPHVNEAPDLDVRFAVSTPIYSIDDLSHTFQQLRHLLHIVGGSGERVLFAQDGEPTTAQEHSYSSTRFYEMLLRGDADVAIALMDEDVRRLKASAPADETEIPQLFFVYRHELVRVKEEFLQTAPTAQVPMALPSYLPQLNVDELFGDLRAYCRALCDCIAANRQSDRESFERRLLSYIDDHLGDTTLCIRTVIDQFSISEGTLRNILSRTAGVSFSEYVEQHRMHQAQLLVLHSTLPVSQIPQQVGYASANTFYKAFKRHFGISPSAMRTQVSDDGTPPNSEN